MKLPTIALSFVLIATSFPSQAQEGPPTLSLAEAAKIAESCLKERNLPQKYFIRSVMLSPSKDDPSTLIYEARFEPPARRVVKRSGPATDESEPEAVTFKVIIVTMDGKASIQEREITQTRRIQRAAISEESGSTN